MEEGETEKGVSRIRLAIHWGYRAVIYRYGCPTSWPFSGNLSTKDATVPPIGSYTKHVWTPLGLSCWKVSKSLSM
jgi:hypothetical protein